MIQHKTIILSVQIIEQKIKILCPGGNMNDKELELIKTAMLHEDEGAAYYTLQSNQWHEAQVSENFKQLAADEQLHSKWIRELFEEKKSFGDAKLLSFLKDQQSPKLFDWTDVKKISDLDVKDVFKKAMDMEEASYKYYQDIKASAEDQDMHKLLDILINWEISHYKTLKEVYDALNV